MTTQVPDFKHSSYVVRKKFFKLFGAAFHIYDPEGKLAFYSKQKAFKLKEDIRVFTDESMQVTALVIKARQIFDMWSTYDVFDATTNARVGALRRKALKSLIRDEWHILDTKDQEIGVIQEDSLGLALVRRFLLHLIPQHFTGSVRGECVCIFSQNFNPFIQKITLDYSMDTKGALDRRLGLAGAILLCAIEGRQRS